MTISTETPRQSLEEFFSIKDEKHFSLILRIIIAVILIQPLRFKFSAHPESVYIFEMVG